MISAAFFCPTKQFAMYNERPSERYAGRGKGDPPTTLPRKKRSTKGVIPREKKALFSLHGEEEFSEPSDRGLCWAF